jgi:hypothetical protein
MGRISLKVYKSEFAPHPLDASDGRVKDRNQLVNEQISLEIRVSDRSF